MSMRLTSFVALLVASALSMLGAGFAGTWALDSKDGEGNPVKSEITFREESGALKAKLKSRDMQYDVDSIKQEGDRVSFVIPWQENRVNIVLNAAGDKISGSWSVEGDSGPITGARVGAAAVSGVWKLAAERPSGGTINVDLDLKSNSYGWQGSLRTGDGAEVPIQDLAVTGEQISFVVPMPQGNVKLTLKVQGNSLKGTWSGADAATGAVTGQR